MNIRDLKYLIAIDNLGHFGDAAKACCVSQPALSMQLKKLEMLLDVQLIERSNKKASLTTVGSQIVERARIIIHETDNIKRIAKIHQDPCSGTMTLGAIPTLAPYCFPDIMPLLLGSYPKLTLLLREEKTHALIEQVKQSNLDAALMALPVIDSELDHIPLFEDEFLLGINCESPLAKREFIKRSDLTNEALLLLEEGHCLHGQALEICQLIDDIQHHPFYATSLETLREMIASGVGSTLIPRIAVREHDKIAYIRFEKPIPSRRIALVYRKCYARKDCLESIAHIIQKHFSNA